MLGPHRLHLARKGEIARAAPDACGVNTACDYDATRVTVGTVKAKERTVMTDVKLTDRQIEFLAQRLLKRSPFHRLSGQYQGKAGAAISAMVSRLEALDMIDSRRYQRITRAGLDAVEQGLGRILPQVDDIAGTLERQINAAIGERRAQLDGEDALEAEQKAALAESTINRIAKRNAAIPAKLFELLESTISSSSVHVVIDAMANVPSKEDLVALWNAIVDADASL